VGSPLLVRVNVSDGKQVEICLDRQVWEWRRAEVYMRDGGLCVACKKLAPLHTITEPEALAEVYNRPPRVIKAGEADHIDNRKMGGGFRNDALSNLRWLCWLCHHLVTVGKLVIA
jgi:hypothetical protein